MRYPAQVLTDAEVRLLMRACGRRPTGVRGRALLAVLYRSGLRVSEALALRPHDLDLAECCIRVLHGKGDKARTVGIDPGALALVSAWLAMWPKLGIPRGSPIFCCHTAGMGGRAMRTSYVRGWLARLARRAGVAKRVHAHGLRHTHATQLSREGVALNLIQLQLGHQSAATTAHYLDHLAAADAVRAVRARRWVEGPDQGG